MSAGRAPTPDLKRHGSRFRCLPDSLCVHTAHLECRSFGVSVNFLIPVLLNFSTAQQRNVLNVIEALLVCLVKYKTLSALTRVLPAEHADQFALADFFRVSPWSATAVRQALTQAVLKIIGTLQVHTSWPAAVSAHRRQSVSE